MKVLALVERPDHVCCRYRIAAFQQQLQLAGIALEIEPLPSGWFARLRRYQHVAEYDAVVLQRKLLSLVELYWLRRHAKRLIFDFDDAIWLRDSYSDKGFDSPKLASRFRRTIQAADDVFAGNPFLAEQARRDNPQCRVHLVPTCVDVEKYPIARHQSQDVTRLVWVGSASTLRGLQHFAGVLELIGQRLPQVRLRLICDRFLKFQHLAVEEVVWSEADEAARIAECDIGISWIPDDPWSRGKCGLKILQFQAAGLPVVTNPVGVHPQLIGHSRGILATTPEQWVQAIADLQNDRSLRLQLGQVARQQVETDYSFMRGAELWEQALRLSSSHRVG